MYMKKYQNHKEILVNPKNEINIISSSKHGIICDRIATSRKYGVSYMINHVFTGKVIQTKYTENSIYFETLCGRKVQINLDKDVFTYKNIDIMEYVEILDVHHTETEIKIILDGNIPVIIKWESDAEIDIICEAGYKEYFTISDNSLKNEIIKKIEIIGTDLFLETESERKIMVEYTNYSSISCDTSFVTLINQKIEKVKREYKRDLSYSLIEAQLIIYINNKNIEIKWISNKYDCTDCLIFIETYNEKIALDMEKKYMEKFYAT